MGKREQTVAFVKVPGLVVFTLTTPGIRYSSEGYHSVFLAERNPDVWSVGPKGRKYKTLTAAIKHSVKLGRDF